MLNLADSPRIADQAMIPVSILEKPETERASAEPPKAPRTRTPLNTRAMIAKQDSLRAAVKSAPTKDRKQNQNELSARAEPLPAPPSQPAPVPTPREIVSDQSIVAERALPTIKELLPPANWSSSGRSNTPVNLNTSDPVYVSYFTKVKQLIEAHWEYPELALRYGLEGKLALEFTIGAHGQLDRLRVVRSSGSQLLDDEALRAIKAASPFPPIPPWIKPNPLSISAAMEYHDNRVNYQLPR